MNLEALGAFLSGAASVATATYVIKRLKREADEECEKRFRAFREGMRAEREK